MTKIRELINYLEEWAPPALQESYDNSGYIYGNPDTEITGVLVALDATEDVILEAQERGCNLVIAHHPIIFKGIKKFSSQDYVSRTIITAIKNDIAIYAIHTNLDNVTSSGVNREIADRLGIKNISALRKLSEEDSFLGAGAIGTLEKAMNEKEFLNHLLDRMNLTTFKHTKLRGRLIEKVAICGGSGTFLLQDAITHKADVYITSDVKYHEFFDADFRLVLCDIGHYESEQYTIDLIQRKIKNKFSTFAVLKTMVNTNPVEYFKTDKNE